MNSVAQIRERQRGTNHSRGCTDFLADLRYMITSENRAMFKTPKIRNAENPKRRNFKKRVERQGREAKINLIALTLASLISYCDTTNTWNPTYKHSNRISRDHARRL
jgi:hypothetical protein